jgi:predicted AAA+ superfamily ATPase
MLAPIRYLTPILLAFDILISYPAQEISYNKLLGQLQDRGNVELIKNYIHLYEGAFLLKALEKYSAKKIKTKSSSPKILPLAPCFWAFEVMSGRKRSEVCLTNFLD